jgi:hypothetical protein
MALLKYSSHSVLFTHGKCIIQGFQYTWGVVKLLPYQSVSEHFVTHRVTHCPFSPSSSARAAPRLPSVPAAWASHVSGCALCLLGYVTVFLSLGVFCGRMKILSIFFAGLGFELGASHTQSRRSPA